MEQKLKRLQEEMAQNTLAVRYLILISLPLHSMDPEEL